jgi:uncharacterized protein (TIGR02466 family)
MSTPPKFNFASAFATPMVETMLADSGALNQRLRDRFLAWERDTSRKRTSVPTAVTKYAVYESDFSLFSNPEPEIQQLASFCLNCTGYVIAQLNGYSQKEMANLRIYQHSWFHITRREGYTSEHNHPMASWSGVYCVDPGEHVDRPNNGALRFLESRGTAGMYLDPGNSRWRPPYGFGTLAYQLVPGQLILFPSYLHHEVAPYYVERERITVAFNAWVRGAGQAVDEPGLRL